MLYGQPYSHDAYDINGNRMALADSAQAIVICYKSGSCASCVRSVTDYCSALSLQYSWVQLVIMIQGDDMENMQNSARAIQRYFPNAVCKIVFDLAVPVRNRYFNKYKIRHYPSLLLVSKQAKKVRYISYERIFADDNSQEILISSDIREVLEKFASNR
jgi:hypothetical protein